MAWSVDTGMPSGQGIASNNVYYLPLRTAAKTKEPEVCAIDIDKGLVVAHTKSRKKTDGTMVVPGNLLFHEGFVLSQTVDGVAVFPQLKIILAQSDELIKNNPKDPNGLTARGKLRLDKGDQAGAIDDLHTALANDPSPETRQEARAALFDSMTELLSRDFNQGEKFLAEYRELCTVDIAPQTSPQGRRLAEEDQQRRLANCLCLVAKGREQQGRLADAFDAYLEIGGFNKTQELISVIDEPTVKTAQDVWARGRISAMIAKAQPEQLAPLEEKIAQKFAEARKGDVQELRRFVGAFGSLLTAGKEARLLLAQHLMEDTSPAAFLDAEAQLLALRKQTEHRQLAGQAVETLARLYARKGMLEDACYCYRSILARDFAKVVIRDGKTGEDIYNEMFTDKRFVGQLDEPEQAWLGRKIKVEEQRGPAQAVQFQRLFTFEPEGELMPFFQNHRLAVDVQFNRFKIIDRATQKEVWSQDLTGTNFLQQYVQAIQQGQQVDQLNAPRYYMLGHMIVLPLGNVVFGIDPVNHRLLWEKTINQNNNVVMNPLAGGQLGVFPGFPDSSVVQRMGQIGPVEPSHVCLQTQDGLVAIDPVTGRTLWTRSDMPAQMELFGDADHVYVVEKSPDRGHSVGTRGSALVTAYRCACQQTSPRSTTSDSAYWAATCSWRTARQTA